MYKLTVFCEKIVKKYLTKYRIQGYNKITLHIIGGLDLWKTKKPKRK